MDKIPFFPQLAVWGPIISGIFIYGLSFNKKQYQGMIDGLGKDFGEKAYKAMRYGGPFMIMCGLLQIYLKS